jgi:predicted phage terminase large subunit-like protein
MNAEEATLALARRVQARRSLYWFTRYGFQQQRGTKWLRNWHHDMICRKLQDVFDGKCKRLIINIPPRYSKTEIAVVNFMAWALGRCPDAEFIHASYSGRLAANNSYRCREIVASEWYGDLFPDVRLAPDSQAKDDWRTDAGGVIYATGAGGSITGYGAGKKREIIEGASPVFGGAIIIDDIHKADEATSDTMRGNVIDWFKNTLESRVNAPNTPIIVIMQRLHEDDLAGWLLGGGNGETWEHLCIPAVNDPPVPIWPSDAPDELWPETHTLESLRRMEKSKPYEFAGQYMQRPAPLGGGIFKTAWWQYYRPAAMPALKRIWQSWDTAFKTKTSNDYSVCTSWGEGTDGNIYLLDVWKEKVEFPELKRMVASKAAQQWGGKSVTAVLVEDKASGQSLIQELQRDTSLAIIAVKVETDKISRAFAVTPLIEGKRVYLPEGAAWVADYISSLGAFPNAAHDDDVDSTTQGLSYYANGSGAQAWVDHFAAQAAAAAA